MKRSRSLEIPLPVQQIFYLYPAIQMGELILFAYLGEVIAFIFVMYFQSPLIWRFLRMIYGQPEGFMKFGKKAQKGCLWYVLLQLQQFYISFPAVENLLKFFPGVYSSWLRLWGSKIGKKVMWTPEVNLYDRTHLDIGDRVLFGSQVTISCHLVNKRGREYVVHVAPVSIGNDVFVGFQTNIGPGSTLGEGSLTDVCSIVYPFTKIAPGERYEKR
jgi:hypothetical protein